VRKLLAQVDDDKRDEVRQLAPSHSVGTINQKELADCPGWIAIHLRRFYIAGALRSLWTSA
jgi:hypothetical protein